MFIPRDKMEVPSKELVLKSFHIYDNPNVHDPGETKLPFQVSSIDTFVYRTFINPNGMPAAPSVSTNRGPNITPEALQQISQHIPVHVRNQASAGESKRANSNQSPKKKQPPGASSNAPKESLVKEPAQTSYDFSNFGTGGKNLFTPISATVSTISPRKSPINIYDIGLYSSKSTQVEDPPPSKFPEPELNSQRERISDVPTIVSSSSFEKISITVSYSTDETVDSESSYKDNKTSEYIQKHERELHTVELVNGPGHGRGSQDTFFLLKEKFAKEGYKEEMSEVEQICDDSGSLQSVSMESTVPEFIVGLTESTTYDLKKILPHIRKNVTDTVVERQSKHFADDDFNNLPKRSSRDPKRQSNIRTQWNRESSQGYRQSSSQGNRQSSSQGNRQSSSQGNRQWSSQGNRQSSSLGNRQSSSQGNRQSSSQGNRQSSSQGNRESSNQGNRQSSSQGNRESSNQGNRQSSSQENRQSSQGNKRSSRRSDKDYTVMSVQIHGDCLPDSPIINSHLKLGKNGRYKDEENLFCDNHTSSNNPPLEDINLKNEPSQVNKYRLDSSSCDALGVEPTSRPLRHKNLKKIPPQVNKYTLESSSCDALTMEPPVPLTRKNLKNTLPQVNKYTLDSSSCDAVTVDPSLSEGEIKCHSSASIGEVRKQTHSNHHFGKFKSKPVPEANVIRERRTYFNHWVTYYINKNKNSSMVNNSSSTTST